MVSLLLAGLRGKGNVDLLANPSRGYQASWAKQPSQTERPQSPSIHQSNRNPHQVTLANAVLFGSGRDEKRGLRLTRWKSDSGRAASSIENGSSLTSTAVKI